MRPYLILNYNYQVNSGGIKVLHRLVHELNAAGYEAYSSNPNVNPEWIEPYYEPPFMIGDWIAVYPEITKSNPWQAPHVARWILNNPAKRGREWFSDSEELFYYHELFNTMGLAPERKLLLPAIELDIYRDMGLQREVSSFWIGKGISRYPANSIEISRELTTNPHDLARVLNQCTVMYSMDPVSGMNDIARLCGCPVVYIPNGDRITREEFNTNFDLNGAGWNELVPLDVAAFRSAEQQRHVEFKNQLANFIRITQS